MKEKCMKFSDCIKIMKPNYMYLRIIPHSSIRNYNSTRIAKMINYTQRKISERIRWEERKLICESPIKCTYIIDIHTNDVGFYFVVPERYSTIAKEKIREVWSKATIEVYENIPPISPKAVKYQLSYKKEDALSLDTDKKSNEPLNNILNVVEIMKDDDRVTILYNFIPHNQYGWTASYDNTINKIKNNLPIDSETTSFKYVMKYALSIFLDFADSIFEAINDMFGTVKNENPLNLVELAVATLNLEKNISPATRKKRSEIVINTQLAVISESQDRYRKVNNAIAVCQAYKSIEQDNELIYKRFNKKLNIEKRFYPIRANKFSVAECQNLIQIPGRELLDEFGNITKVNTLESQVPEELQTDYIRLGINKFKGKAVRASLSKDKHLANLGLVVMGSQGSGKTEYLANYVKDVIRANESAIVIDFIDKCQLSDTIKKVVPKDKLIEINVDDPAQAQAFAFNETDIHNTNTDRIEIANMQTQMMIAFINSINSDAELSSRMRRSLSSAANIVFMHENTSLRDVVDCLSNHNMRKDFIDRIPEEYKGLLKDDINNLIDMHEIDRKTGDIIGTKESKMDFILDRISLLMEDIKLKRMFNKSGSDNLNFCDLMNQGKIVLIKIPEYKFPTTFHKNILVTFYIAKIWLASQMRGVGVDDLKRCSVIVDEIFQAPTSQNQLLMILPQGRKFKIKFVLSCHYLSQIDTIKEALKASGASYMLLQGTDERNYNEMKNDLLPYEVEDLLNLKRFHSLNMIKYSKGYAKFITELPKPI